MDIYVHKISDKYTFAVSQQIFFFMVPTSFFLIADSILFLAILNSEIALFSSLHSVIIA